jgi:hypothetical protein
MTSPEPCGFAAALGRRQRVAHSTEQANLRFIVWCKECRHQVEPDPAEMVERYEAETSVFDCGNDADIFAVKPSITAAS